MSARTKISVSDCLSVTALYHGLSIAQMRGVTRKRRIARPRQIAMALARELTGASLPAIGRKFGDKDHTTVLHATRHIASLVRGGDGGTVTAITALLTLIPACVDVQRALVQAGPCADLIDWADLRRACLESDEEGWPIARQPVSAKPEPEYVDLQVRQHLRRIASERDAVRLTPLGSAMAQITRAAMMGGGRRHRVLDGGAGLA